MLARSGQIPFSALTRSVPGMLLEIVGEVGALKLRLPVSMFVLFASRSHTFTALGCAGFLP